MTLGLEQGCYNSTKIWSMDKIIGTILLSIICKI